MKYYDNMHGHHYTKETSIIELLRSSALSFLVDLSGVWSCWNVKQKEIDVEKENATFMMRIGFNVEETRKETI